MTLQQLQTQIRAKNLDNVMLFYGEEVAIMDIYLKKIYAVLGATPVSCDTVQDAFSKITRPRIAGGSRVFLVRDDAAFFKADTLWATVFAAAESAGETLILTYSSMDKRSKFYKRNQERLCEFEKLSPTMLANYIDKLLPGMSQSARVEFAELCECNYSRIMLEADKVRHWEAAMGGTPNYEKAFKELVHKGVIYKPIGDITFQFTDAILLRNHKLAAQMLMKAKAVGESEILTLSVLYSGFKNILMVQGLGRDQSEPSKRTGLTPWQVKLAKEKMGHYSLEQLVHALKVIRDVEKGIKTGTIDADIAVEYVMVNVM